MSVAHAVPKLRGLKQTLEERDVENEELREEVDILAERLEKAEETKKVMRASIIELRDLVCIISPPGCGLLTLAHTGSTVSRATATLCQYPSTKVWALLPGVGKATLCFVLSSSPS